MRHQLSLFLLAACSSVGLAHYRGKHADVPKHSKPSDFTTPPTHGSLPPPPPPTTGPTLEEALIAGGCNKFLAWLQASPEIWTLFTSGVVKTVFCPADPFFVDPDLGRRRLAPNLGRKAFHGINTLSRLAQRGVVLESVNDNANLGGGNQSVVSTSGGSSGGSKKRQAPGAIPSISSGLGNAVSVIQGNIPFDNGLVQVTNGLFTPPLVFSDTVSQLPEGNTFSALAAQANLKAILDGTPRLTTFLPTEAAIAAAAAAGLSVDISGHIVEGIDPAGSVGYTPSLVDGMVFKSVNGLTLTVTEKDGNLFINDAMITQGNVILDNGVFHLVDKVLFTSN